MAADEKRKEAVRWLFGRELCFLILVGFLKM
jgi:hypothetical protein